MSIFSKGRGDLEAWGEALYEAGGGNVPPDAELYAAMTEPIIRNNCRIITQSAYIVMTAEYDRMRFGGEELMKSRYKKLKALAPYADACQRRLIRETRAYMKRAIRA